MWNQPLDDTPFELDTYKNQVLYLSVCIKTIPMEIVTISTLAIRKTPIWKASFQCPTNGCLQVIIIWSVQPTLSFEIVIFLKGNLGIISLKETPTESAYAVHLSSTVLQIMRSKPYICECTCECSSSGIYLEVFNSQTYFTPVLLHHTYCTASPILYIIPVLIICPEIGARKLRHSSPV